jgi:ABC-type polar amino acid transport system ATPase subunit
MPKVDSRPGYLKFYEGFGIDLSWDGVSKDVMGDCPNCDAARKFGVTVKTGQFNCFHCEFRGNTYSFLSWLWEEADDTTTTKRLGELQEQRDLIFPETLMAWGVVQSLLTREWLIPGYSTEKKLHQLYKYTSLAGKMRLLAAATHGHQLHGVNLYDEHKSIVYVCEGPWDGMALFEMLSHTKYDRSQDEYSITYDKSLSLLADANVLAVPGCQSFHERWGELLHGKHVIFCYDSDHPRENPRTKKKSSPAGESGIQKALATMAASGYSAESVCYVKWGEDGYDPNLPSGYDVRDSLGTGGLEQRLTGLRALLGRIHTVPEEWITEPSVAANSRNRLAPKVCTSYDQLVEAWKKAMRWTSGLDQALSVILASVCSTQFVGDQLWVKVIGPASCGKSTLCEAVSVARRWTKAKSTFTGFHTGYKAGGEDRDVSLVAELDGKTFILKDGDTLLQKPNLQQILSEARDIYDGVSRTHYRNAVNREYQGHRMTWVLCGTSSLRALDSSELGERFLDCVIMEGIDDDLEDEVLERVADRADILSSTASNGDVESHQDPVMTEVMRLTGGYVEHLRKNDSDLLKSIVLTKEARRQCIKLGKFVAFMRARPSNKQSETAEREFGARLVSQHIRLAKNLTVVLNKTETDAEVMGRVRQVALDTSRGQVLEVVDFVYNRQEEGTKPKAVSVGLGYPEDKTRILIRFLKKIEVLETFQRKQKHMSAEIRTRLTKKIVDLYEEVVLYSKGLP